MNQGSGEPEETIQATVLVRGRVQQVGYRNKVKYSTGKKNFGDVGEE